MHRFLFFTQFLIKCYGGNVMSSSQLQKNVITLEIGKELSLLGVKDIRAFDEQSVVLQTDY